MGPATMNERKTATEHLTFSTTHIGYNYCTLEVELVTAKEEAFADF